MKNLTGLLFSVIAAAVVLGAQTGFAQADAVETPAVEQVEAVLWNQWILTAKEGVSVKKCIDQVKKKNFYVEQVLNISGIIIFLAPPSSPDLSAADFTCAADVEFSGQVDATAIAGVSN